MTAAPGPPLYLWVTGMLVVLLLVAFLVWFSMALWTAIGWQGILSGLVMLVASVVGGRLWERWRARRAHG